MLVFLAACSDYEVKADGHDAAGFDTADSFTPPLETAGDSEPEDTGSVVLPGDTDTAPPDPCTWDTWVSDDSCAGAWGGTGVDGDVTLDGAFAPFSTSVAVDATASTTLVVTDGAGFSVDDEVFVHAFSGDYALVRVTGVVDDTLTLGSALTIAAGSVVQRVPHYRDVTVGEVTGTRVVFRACGIVTVDGNLSATGGGWLGGQRTLAIPELGWQGADAGGAGAQSDAPNGTGGGGGSESCNVHADGGGGGYATAGAKGGDWDSYSCGGPGGQGGGTAGSEDLATLLFGGGGGSGYNDTDAGPGSYGGAGGAGGGLVYVVASGGFTGAGTIRADGATGEDGFWADGGASPGGGGGGAGGSVRLVGDVGVAVSAVGGTGGEGSEAGSSPTYGGTGGDGRVRIDGAWTGTSTPTAYEACR